MNKSIFMRVLFCKIHCPSFICFCKPSAAHLYTPAEPLKLENTQHVPSSTTVSSQLQQQAACDGETTIEVKDESLDNVNNKEQQPKEAIKSCIRKVPFSPKDLGEKRVQWMDNLGKQLVEIKEFESSETGDTDNEEDNRGCVCAIL